MFDAFSPFSMVVFIVLIVTVAGTIDNWIKLQAERKGSSADEAELAALRSDVARLKARVETLERIATDKDHRLHEEISRLA